MTTEELQNIFFERMNKKLAGVVSLNELPAAEVLDKVLKEIPDKDMKAIESGKTRTIDKYIRKFIKEK